jgi:hypothetical protein
VTDGSLTTTAPLAALARRRGCPPLTLTTLLGDRGDREDGNEPGEQGESGESSHGGLQESRHACVSRERIAIFTVSRSQPFLSDGTFERREPVLDLGNPALELFERAGHVQ